MRQQILEAESHEKHRRRESRLAEVSPGEEVGAHGVMRSKARAARASEGRRKESKTKADITRMERSSKGAEKETHAGEVG